MINMFKLWLFDDSYVLISCKFEILEWNEYLARFCQVGKVVCKSTPSRIYVELSSLTLNCEDTYAQTLLFVLFSKF